MKRIINKMVFITISLFIVLLCQRAGASINEDEIRSTLADQREVSVTIYNDQLALIKDLRNIQLKDGFNNLAFREVSAQSGYAGQNSLVVHFGLGDASQVDSIIVHWPAGGMTQGRDVRSLFD